MAAKVHLSDVESIVDLVLERTHLDDPDKALVDDRLRVELGQQGRELVAEEMRLVVRGRVERREIGRAHV